MKESYLAADFRKTVAQRFAAQEKELNAAFDARLQADRSTWRVDMTKCPYYDTCVQYGPGALPVLLRQRRYHLRKSSPEASPASDGNAGQGQRLLRFLPADQRIVRGM